MALAGGLTIRGLRKHFGGVKALRGVSLEFQRGRVHALLGANGAGKSTLISVCTGSVTADQGQVELDSRQLHLSGPREAFELGIAVVHQEPAVMPSLTVAQNLAIEEVGGMRMLRPLSRKTTTSIAEAKLRQLGITLPLDARLGTLPVSTRQLVEIARAVSSDPQVLFLDEPNSALSHSETERLLSVSRKMADQGCAVVFVSHRLREVFSIADDVSVLRDGSLVWTGAAADITIAEAVGQMAGGKTAAEVVGSVVAAEVQAAPTEVLRVSGLTRKREFHDVDLRAVSGEVLGISGLIGSGRTELVSCLAGLSRPSVGRMLLAGQERSWRSPAQAWKAGVSIVPEDRQEFGLFPDMSVEWNMTSACRSLGIEPVMPALQMAQRLGIKTPSLQTPVSALSGGNQQKVVIGRALLTDPRLLILDEPTRGVDVSAKADIYALIREQARRGCAVILVSSELDEVTELSDRIVVMRQGRVVEEFGPHPSNAQLIAAAFGEAA